MHKFRPKTDRIARGNVSVTQEKLENFSKPSDIKNKKGYPVCLSTKTTDEKLIKIDNKLSHDQRKSKYFVSFLKNLLLIISCIPEGQRKAGVIHKYAFLSRAEKLLPYYYPRTIRFHGAWSKLLATVLYQFEGEKILEKRWSKDAHCLDEHRTFEILINEGWELSYANELGINLAEFKKRFESLGKRYGYRVKPLGLKSKEAFFDIISHPESVVVNKDNETLDLMESINDIHSEQMPYGLKKLNHEQKRVAKVATYILNKKEKLSSSHFDVSSIRRNLQKCKGEPVFLVGHFIAVEQQRNFDDKMYIFSQWVGRNQDFEIHVVIKTDYDDMEIMKHECIVVGMIDEFENKPLIRAFGIIKFDPLPKEFLSIYENEGISESTASQYNELNKFEWSTQSILKEAYEIYNELKGITTDEIADKCILPINRSLNLMAQELDYAGFFGKEIYHKTDWGTIPNDFIKLLSMAQPSKKEKFFADNILEYARSMEFLADMFGENVRITLPGRRPGKIWIFAHMDVWKAPIKPPNFDRKEFHGTGSIDAIGRIFAVLWAMKWVKELIEVPHYTIELVLTTKEEQPDERIRGINQILDSTVIDPSKDIIIFAEPTNLSFKTGHPMKRVLRYTISTIPVRRPYTVSVVHWLNTPSDKQKPDLLILAGIIADELRDLSEYGKYFIIPVFKPDSIDPNYTTSTVELKVEIRYINEDAYCMAKERIRNHCSEKLLSKPGFKVELTEVIPPEDVKLKDLFFINNKRIRNIFSSLLKIEDIIIKKHSTENRIMWMRTDAKLAAEKDMPVVTIFGAGINEFEHTDQERISLSDIITEICVYSSIMACLKL